MKICMISGTFPPIKCGVGDYSNILCDYLSQVGEKFEPEIINSCRN